MIRKTTVICLSIWFALIDSGSAAAQSARIDTSALRHVIPLGGNAWVNSPDTISDDGLMGWKSSECVAAVYFRVSVAQDIRLALRLKVAEGKSTIKVSVGKDEMVKEVGNTAFDTVEFGRIRIARPGYVKVNLTGINKRGASFADVTDLVVTLQTPDTDIAYVAQGSSFHFGRRGPSVNMRYPVPDGKKSSVKWFYNEIMVPDGQDIIGSYFMADGFREGYFGMQVNSATERRVLFSVWSPFKTDDPKSIPDGMRVRAVKHGSTVHIGEFGNEGAGGQSYMPYPWQAGRTYAFLLSAEPDPAREKTTYTAYFKDAAAGKWFLVASFTRPQTLSYLTQLHSFVENFDPANGDRTRKAFFANQWIVDGDNNWQELTEGDYAGDSTADENYRKDYVGGSSGSRFFLQNGGFFDEYTPLKTSYKRISAAQKPEIALAALPNN